MDKLSLTMCLSWHSPLNTVGACNVASPSRSTRRGLLNDISPYISAACNPPASLALGPPRQPSELYTGNFSLLSDLDLFVGLKASSATRITPCSSRPATPIRQLKNAFPNRHSCPCCYHLICDGSTSPNSRATSCK